MSKLRCCLSTNSSTSGHPRQSALKRFTVHGCPVSLLLLPLAFMIGPKIQEISWASTIEMTTTTSVVGARNQYLFANWGKKHGKEYMTDEEHDSRMSVFMANDALIKSHNADQRHDYKLGHNEFSDLTFDEFKELYMPHHGRPIAPSPEEFEYKLIDFADSAPVSKDWVTEGAVNPVQNQGQCGSCWAFSSTSAAEGADYIRTKVLKKFSEQDLIDCNYGGVYDNSGCDGGVIDYAFVYMIENGQCLESDYPYIESQGTCEASLCDRSQLTI